MKIIIECTKEEKEEMLSEKCPGDFLDDETCYVYEGECGDCEECYNKNNIEFKIIENKD